MQYLNFLCYVNDILQTFTVVAVCSVGDALLPTNTCSSLIVFSNISASYRKKKKKKNCISAYIILMALTEIFC